MSTFEERCGPWICCGCGRAHKLGDACPTDEPKPAGNPGVQEQLWKDPDWTCPNPACQFVNFAIRQKCRNCGYDSNAGEFPYYNPLPPYQGLDAEARHA